MTKPCFILVTALIVVMSACAADRSASRSASDSIPEVHAEGYPPFRITMEGDSHWGTISENPRIEFDCGPLASTYVAPDGDNWTKRWHVARTEKRVGATIRTPPDGARSEYYPINVYSSQQDVSEAEVKRLAFEIEKAVLAHQADAR